MDVWMLITSRRFTRRTVGKRTPTNMNKALDLLFEAFTCVWAVLASIALLAAMSFTGGVFWGGIFWAGLAIWLGLCEGISYLKTGKTLSTQWRELLKDPKRSGYAKWLITSWYLLFGILAGHLLL